MFTQFGPSAVMRFTGEFSTYDFNTFWNVAYMTTRYEIPTSTSCCFAGDDSLFFHLLTEKQGWTYLSAFFELVGKTFHSPVPDFCGWWLTPAGIVRNPVLLALKLVYADSLNRLVDVLDSYFLEALFAYNIADRLYGLIPDLALEAQSWVINFCFKHSSLVPHLSLTSRLVHTFVNYFFTKNPPKRLLLQLQSEVDSGLLLSKILLYKP